MVIGMFGGLTFPSLNALMSQRIPPSSQGELQGAVASLFSLTAIVGPVLMTQLFGYFTSTAAPIQFPGAAFICAAVLVLLSIALFLQAERPGREIANSEPQVDRPKSEPSDVAATAPEAKA
jgi:DHA1 family tetracycline resistance protein-like MFS transporter